MTRSTITVTIGEVEAKLSATMILSDLGVSGSPVWYEPENITLDHVAVLGVTISNPPDALLDAILEYVEWHS